MKYIIVRSLLAMATGCLCTTLYAASLQMYPITVNFCHGQSTEPVYVKNTGSEPIGAQLRLFLWQQKDHQDQLIPTQNLISSPPIASIPGGKEQLVRIISPTALSGTGAEQSYRLLVDELPGTKAQTDHSEVRFLLRYSVPVFVNCSAKKIDLSTVYASLQNNGAKRQLLVRNTGQQHLKLSNVSLVAGGKNYPISQGLLGYVLPASEMVWTLPAGTPAGNELSVIVNDNATRQVIPLSN